MKRLVALAVAGALVLPAGALARSGPEGLHYVASSVPRGFQPHEAWTYSGLSSLWYAKRHDPLRTITVHTHFDGRCCYDSTTVGHRIRVRGHRGWIAQLKDGETAYGRTIFWKEWPDVWVEVVDQAGIPERVLKRIAEHVRLADEPEWRRILIATTLIPSDAELRARPSKVLDRGAIDGHRWSFRARIPRGYPLFSWDRRVPCPELRFRGSTLLAPYDCEQFPSRWRLFGDQIWVYGALGKRGVRRVRVRDAYDKGDPGVVVPVRAALPGFKFYVAPMPRDTCEVAVEDAGKPPGRGLIAPEGPAGYEPAEARRCGMHAR